MKTECVSVLSKERKRRKKKRRKEEEDRVSYVLAMERKRR